MIGAILEVEDTEYISIDRIFPDMGKFYLKYNWLISDYDCYQYPTAKISFNNKYEWLTGAELDEIMKHNHMPFIWGALSGFSPEITLEEVLSFGQLPFAEGAESFWKSEFTLQHPLSEIEVVAWEATYFIIMSKKAELIHRSREKFPLSEDLWKYNKDHGW